MPEPRSFTLMRRSVIIRVVDHCVVGRRSWARRVPEVLGWAPGSTAGWVLRGGWDGWWSRKTL